MLQGIRLIRPTLLLSAPIAVFSNYSTTHPPLVLIKQEFELAKF